MLSSWGSRLRRIGWLAFRIGRMLLLSFLLAPVVLTAVMLPLENNLVYFPSSQITATPADYGLAYEELELTTADGLSLHAWALPYDDDAPWLLYFHGNGQNISHYLPFARSMRSLGLNIFMLSYRGYGQSEGSPSEAGLHQDAMAAYQALLERGVAPENILLYGFSLGTGVAVQLAYRVQVAGVILEAPYTSLPDVARAAYGPWVPGFLMRNRFDSLAYIAGIDAPLLIMHSSQDRLIPLTQGRRLYAAAKAPKTFLEMRGPHYVLLEGSFSDEVWQALRNFIGKI